MRMIHTRITVLLAAMLCMAIALLSWRAYEIHRRSKAPTINKRPIVVIDAGHGTFTDIGLLDYGATRHGIREADVVFEIARCLHKKLECNGWIAVTTRDGEFTPLSLIERSMLASYLGADAFISIHTNSFRTRHPSGLSVHYWSEESKQLAELIQTILSTKLGMKDRGVVKHPFTVLVWASVPAVLIELGFISNPQEATRLANPQFHRKAADAIAQALTLWIHSRCDEDTTCF
ncbi:MAG: N-acetylmuramoyl-L-alanine amidase [Armatimonadota bacterium]|nr:N-acetylmuramoyl-L-alanine amidase [Armatimonadota bacterium]MCX7776743.1 N-acetylmuramoyl-L-alanine amidase [Armatimonadota bacterium]MDW8024541.1 N-acetylmuramoyl-L-alanine amidase [Armatimonadota bacterium]